MTPNELISQYRNEAVGSTVTCIPVPENADLDTLILVPDIIAFAMQAQAGFEYAGKYEPPKDLKEDSFTCFKKGTMDLIVCTSEKFFQRFIAATHVSRRLNLLVKEDRIMLFQAVLYAKCWTQDELPTLIL